jgi:hypothetical protein
MSIAPARPRSQPDPDQRARALIGIGSSILTIAAGGPGGLAGYRLSLMGRCGSASVLCAMEGAQWKQELCRSYGRNNSARGARHSENIL